mmetsp:Transcript_29385/g.98348  ORF Transcript_29385/g.98348 Transcript_29385/m.98348 type:complete len:274 (+) Transcript_29385:576-1397(+)
MSGFLRSVPSPEQGTSHRTRSYAPAGPGIRCAGAQQTTVPGTRQHASRTRSLSHRWGLISLATMTPPRLVSSDGPAAGAARRESRSTVLEPGAAHMSRTASPRLTPSSSGGSIDTASCRLSRPSPTCVSMKARSVLKEERSARSSLRGASSCQPRLSGNQSSGRMRLGAATASTRAKARTRPPRRWSRSTTVVPVATSAPQGGTRTGASVCGRALASPSTFSRLITSASKRACTRDGWTAAQPVCTNEKVDGSGARSVSMKPSQSCSGTTCPR